MHVNLIILSGYDTVVSKCIPKSTVFGARSDYLRVSVGEPGFLQLIDVSEMYQNQIVYMGNWIDYLPVSTDAKCFCQQLT